MDSFLTISRGAMPVRDGAVLVGSCCCGGKCPPSSPLSLNRIWQGWKAEIWWEMGIVELPEHAGEKPSDPTAEETAMCIRFVWLCIEEGKIQSWQSLGGYVHDPLPKVLPYALAAQRDGQFVFAIEFFGWRTRLPLQGEGGPKWSRLYHSSNSKWKIHRWPTLPV